MLISKRARKQQQEAANAGYLMIDVTSTSDNLTYQKFSPFYPHGSIPVPGLPGKTSMSVEGIWQGLKVFEHENAIDASKFAIKNMKKIKRPANDGRGKVLGHLYGDTVTPYIAARKQIYLPSYRFVLDNYLQNELLYLEQLARENDKKLAFLDYATNADMEDGKKPLSHAWLVIKELKARLGTN